MGRSWLAARAGPRRTIRKWGDPETSADLGAHPQDGGRSINSRSRRLAVIDISSNPGWATSVSRAFAWTSQSTVGTAGRPPGSSIEAPSTPAALAWFLPFSGVSDGRFGDQCKRRGSTNLKTEVEKHGGALNRRKA